MTTKFCKDCKWLSKQYDECENPNNYDIINFVTGEKKRDIVYAQNVRAFRSRCGVEGKWWEQRTEEVVEDKKQRIGNIEICFVVLGFICVMIAFWTLLVN